MRRILLTGATGFLGSYVARALVAQQYDIVAIHRPLSKFDLVADIYYSISWVECDLLDLVGLEEICQSVDMIVHCAAMVSFQPDDKQKMYQVNVEATQDLVNLALEYKHQRFVHISSIAALGRPNHKNQIDEQTDWIDHPDNSYYAISKHLGEQEVWRGQAEGLDTIILNPSLIIGAGYFDSGTAAIIERQYKGNKIYPKGSTGLVDVRDVAKFVVAALESQLSGERFIISGTNSSYKNFLGELALALGKKAPSIPLNQLMIQLIWRLDQLKSWLTRSARLVSKENLTLANKHNSFKNDKSSQLDPSGYIHLSQTIEDMSKAYMQALQENKAFAVMT